MLVLTDTYDLIFSLLSSALAILSFYTLFDAAERVSFKRGASSIAWLICGAAAAAVGIWSMHLIRMIAFREPLSLTFHSFLTMAAVVTAAAGTFALLIVLILSFSSRITLFLGSIGISTAVFLMHQIGMYLTHMHYRIFSYFFVLAFCMSVLLSSFSLFFVFYKHSKREKSGPVRKFIGAAILGTTASSVHYVLMGNTTASAVPMEASSNFLDLTHSLLASVITITGFIIMLLIITGAFLDRRYAIRLQKETEAALITAETTLRNTLRRQQGLTFTFYERDGQFIFTLCDGELLYRCGFTPEQVVGKTLFDLLPYADAVSHTNFYRQAWKGEEPVMFECTLRSKSYLIVLQPVKQGGQVTEVIGSCIDITERKQIESQLQRVFSTLDVSLWTNDLQQKRILINACGMEKIFGLPPEAFEHDASPWLNMIHPDDRALIHATQEKLLNGEPIAREYRIIDSTGKIKWLHDRIIPTVDTAGTLLYLDGIAIDITEQKRMEKALREEKDFIKAILDTTEALTIVVDDKGRIIIFNQACEVLTGYASEQLLSRPFWETELFDRDEINKMREEYKRMLAGETIDRTEWHCYTKNKERRLISWKLSLIKEDDGSVKYIVGAGIDITEWRLAEERIHQAEKLSIVGQLAAGVAHEIRNPLTSLKGFLQLLYETADEKLYFDIMLKDLERIENITSEFLFLAKPESASLQPINVIEMLEEALSFIAEQAMLQQNILITEYTSDNGIIYGNANEIKQLFINLLQNAVEATEEGGEILISMDIQEKRHVLINITDHGCGIHPERLARLGEPFYTTKEKGIGLGLMVSYKIIERHQGEIEIESTVGVGTTVSVLLPLYSCEQSPYHFSSQACDNRLQK
ncbi:PAS domain S-box protein [Aneurinibacillus sp. BA2021]|nr:PAS domain S-box protein [Aneurinibacillus sp. BA2021]